MGMRSTKLVLALLALLLGNSTAVATEVYRWVDEDGVSHFSQNPPPEDVDGVKKMTLEDTTPPDYDPDEDRYNVAEQEKRMASIRDDMQEKRDAERERRRKAAAQQPAIQYQQPYPYGYSSFLRPGYPGYPVQPLPPLRPQPPIAVPYQTVPFNPPGLNR